MSDLKILIGSYIIFVLLRLFFQRERQKGWVLKAFIEILLFGLIVTLFVKFFD